MQIIAGRQGDAARPQLMGLAVDCKFDGPFANEPEFAVGMLVSGVWHGPRIQRGFVYLNVLAGTRRSMAASDDPRYAPWRAQWPEPDPRVPLVAPPRSIE